MPPVDAHLELSEGGSGPLGTVMEQGSSKDLFDDMGVDDSDHLKRSGSPIQPLEHGLEVLPDILDDETHSALDKQIIDARRHYGSDLYNLSTVCMLLLTIQKYSNGVIKKFDSAFDAERLLHDNEKLVVAVQEAWRGKSFRVIRNLRILRNLEHLSKTAATGVSIELKEAVINAWASKYKGQAHIRLMIAIDELHAVEAGLSYAKILPITQSSGTGKSKTVDEMAKERIVIPLCLRENLGKNVFAYPLPDDAVREHLIKAPSTDDEKLCKEFLRSFLASLFKRFSEWVKKSITTKTTYLHMARAFYDYIGDTERRALFYRSVLDFIEPGIDGHGLEESFENTRKTLADLCSNWPAKGTCPIILSLDEVHPLFQQRATDVGPHTVFSRLKSALSDLVKCALCTLCLSTVSSVSALAPPSFREGKSTFILPTPFTELSFDVHIIDAPLRSLNATLQTVGSFKFTAKFGRPMFYSTYLSRIKQGGSEGKVCEDLMNVAQTKLSGIDGPLDTAAQLNASSIAILSARLLLDIAQTSSLARRYEEDQVRSHLRSLYSVHWNHETLVTGSSPEPLIAEASARLMHTNSSLGTPFMDVWKLVIQFVNDGFLPQGHVGELLGRVLSILAMDRAINAQITSCELKYQSPVNVLEYYKALLTDEAWNALKKSTPANYLNLTKDTATTSFEKAFSNAYFHFSHYGKAGDESPLQDQYVWAMWLRGTAVLCQLNQKLTDRALPIFFSEPNRVVSGRWMSVALEQDKTSHDVYPAFVGIQSAESLNVFTEGQKLAYIAAVHCYALTGDHGNGISVTSKTRNERWCDEDEAAPRYQIDFRGLTAYRGLTRGMMETIRTMIDNTKNAIFVNHPRQQTLSGVRMMLPLLNKHPDATAWINGLPGSGNRETGDRESGVDRRASKRVRKL